MRPIREVCRKSASGMMIVLGMARQTRKNAAFAVRIVRTADDYWRRKHI